MRRGLYAVIYVFLCCGVQPAMSESTFSKEHDEPIFMAVGNKDPEFAQAISASQASLTEFRKLLLATEHSQETGAIRMIKTRVSEGAESMWLWLSIEKDNGTGFEVSVFEAPPQFPSLKVGTRKFVDDAQVADWAVVDEGGLVNGGYSLRLARSRLPESERASYDSYIGAKEYAPLPSH